ncbi:conserved hypothetical protein [Bradyrhizobium sp. ORS 375]|nr:conserved hypothetical protein [Bradyrhizobium sp. ORS 375]
MLLRLTGHDDARVDLTPVDLSSFEGSLREADQRQYATDDEIKAIWAKRGL